MKVSREKEDFREEIITQAQALFRQYGLKKTTMDEIAAATGKAKATLYHYFRSKEEVFEAMLDREMKHLRKSVKEKVDAQKGVFKKVETYLNEFFKGIFERANLYRLVSSDVLNGQKSKAYFKEFFTFEKRYFKRLLEDGLDAGELKSIPREEMDWFAEMFLTGFFGIMKHSIEYDTQLTPDHFKKAIDRFVKKILE
ncbi:MAG: TetR/AcrR family transcriptional regulator [Bacteroidetes bacterium]|nr:MAG: TetR/AcrR family transcriptional regulator [Bacteroidota bacterium]